MDKTDRRTALFGALTALLGSPIVGAKNAKAATVMVYNEHGQRIVIDTGTLTGPVNYYTAVGAPYVVNPAVPTAPIYGPYGVRGQARRVRRRILLHGRLTRLET